MFGKWFLFYSGLPNLEVFQLLVQKVGCCITTTFETALRLPGPVPGSVTLEHHLREYKKLALIQSICSRTLLDEVEGRLFHIVQQFCDVSLWSSYKQRDFVFCCAVTLAESQNKVDKMVNGLEALMDKESHTECLKPKEDTAGQKIPALVWISLKRKTRGSFWSY